MRFRGFYSVRIGNRPKIRSLLEELGGIDHGLKLVDPESFHVTLKFLGDVEEALLPELERVLERASLKLDPFVVTLAGVQAFPTVRRPSVVFVGARPERPLAELAETLEEGTRLLGIPSERRAFHAHVTLARTRTPDVPGLGDFLHRHRGWEGDEVEISEIHLMRSHLSPQGPIYTTLSTQRLGRRGGSREVLPP